MTLHRAGPNRGDFDLLVVGELNPDIVVTGAPLQPTFGQVETIVQSISLEIGSSSAIAACGAARLGLRTAFVGVVGDDQFGEFMLQALEERGIDVSGCRIDPADRTGASIILGRGGDRAVLTAAGTIENLRATDIPRDLLMSARHLHVGSIYLQPDLARELPAVLAFARGAGMTTSFDTNWDPSGSWDGGIDGLLQVADVFLPNEEEARRIAGREDVMDAAAELIRRATSNRQPGHPFTVAIKLGPAGGLALRRDTNLEVARVPGLPVELVDTTGAGDSFDAGFLYGVIAGWPLRQSLELAVACGSLSVRGVGGTAAQPTLAEARKAFAASWPGAPESTS